MGGLERARIPFIVQSRPGFSAPKRFGGLEGIELPYRLEKRFGCASPGSTLPSSRLGGDVECLQVGMPLRALSQNRESRAGAMSSDASGECRTTSESFVKKNFSTDVSFSFLKHRSPAEHLKVNEVDQFRDSKFVSDLVRCGRAM